MVKVRKETVLMKIERSKLDPDCVTISLSNDMVDKFVIPTSEDEFIAKCWSKALIGCNRKYELEINKNLKNIYKRI